MLFYLKGNELCSDTVPLDCFTKTQKAFLTDAFKAGYSLEYLANPDLEVCQMRAVAVGLDHNLDVSLFAKSCYNEKVMHKIIDAMQAYPAFTKYLKGDYDPRQIAVLAEAAINGLDLYAFADPNIRAETLAAVIKGLLYEKRLQFNDTTLAVAYPSYTVQEMANKYALVKNDEILSIFNDKFNACLVSEILKKDLWGGSELEKITQFSIDDFVMLQRKILNIPDVLESASIGRCLMCNKPTIFIEPITHAHICSNECYLQAITK